MSTATIPTAEPRVHPELRTRRSIHVHAYQLKLVAAVEAGLLRGGVLTTVHHRGSARPIPALPVACGAQLVVVTHRPGCPIAWDANRQEWARYCACDAAVQLPGGGS